MFGFTLIRSDEGLTLEMSAFASLYGGLIDSVEKTKHSFLLILCWNSFLKR